MIDLPSACQSIKVLAALELLQTLRSLVLGDHRGRMPELWVVVFACVVVPSESVA